MQLYVSAFDTYMIYSMLKYCYFVTTDCELSDDDDESGDIKPYYIKPYLRFQSRSDYLYYKL